MCQLIVILLIYLTLIHKYLIFFKLMKTHFLEFQKMLLDDVNTVSEDCYFLFYSQ